MEESRLTANVGKIWWAVRALNKSYLSITYLPARRYLSKKNTLFYLAFFRCSPHLKQLAPNSIPDLEIRDDQLLDLFRILVGAGQRLAVFMHEM